MPKLLDRKMNRLLLIQFHNQIVGKAKGSETNAQHNDNQTSR